MTTEQSDYKVELDAYSGPLDLLLYLIRRDELDIYNIPISRVTEQYLRYVEVMSELNINVAGEFIVMAAMLIEIKSRMMSPDPEPIADEEDQLDPRLQLVRQLMEYKRFKEAAVLLADRADLQAQRFSRLPDKVEDVPGATQANAPGVTIWALLDAFSRILEQTGARSPHNVVLEDIPQAVLQERLETKVSAAGRLKFTEAFDGQVSRPILIGTFLALLELTRQQVIRPEQEETFGEIWLIFVPLEERKEIAPLTPEPSQAQAQEPAAPASGSAESDDSYGDADDYGEDDEDMPEQPLDFELPEVPEIADAEPPAPKDSAGESDATPTDSAESQEKPPQE